MTEQSAEKNTAKAKGSSGTTAVKKKKKSRAWQWVLAFLLFLLLLACVPVGWFMWKYSKAEVPEPGEIETAQISSIYFNDGENELARLVPPEGNREQVPLESVPEEVQNAVLAAEDRDFWTNSGFSP
ncbi:transglycosylase domain-containing protein, partial [Corynebacterium lehmanniae]|nr:transglycosylase domain-containing protein [Corynebacterium lehmanniae]